MPTTARHKVFIAAVLSLAAVECSPQMARAQGSGAAPARAQVIESMGIRALVTNVTKSDNSFSVQMQIENQRKNTIYIAPVSAFVPGGGNTALVASGKQFMLANAGQGLVGMDPCYGRQSFAIILSNCIKVVAIENMTAIEPMHRAVLGATYDGQGDPGTFASFALKFVVRDAPAQSGALGLKSDKPAAPGPASIVSLSFPLIAFSDDK